MFVQLLMFALLGFVAWRLWRRRGSSPRRPSMRPGPGTMGTIYDMLNEDQRKAIEIIVEQKAAETRPEYADGNLPDLEHPRSRTGDPQ